VLAFLSHVSERHVVREIDMKGVNRDVWIVLGGAAATFIGSFLPWATGPFGIAVSGTSGDGILSIILSVPMAIFGWLMLRKRWATIATIVISLLVIAMMVFEAVHVSSTEFASLGIGIVVCLVGGIAGLVGAIVRIRGGFESTPGDVAAAPPPPVVSPDGQWWWDGTAWHPIPQRDA
jgi:drug/metabolite transporter (DMT)-like permease